MKCPAATPGEHGWRALARRRARSDLARHSRVHPVVRVGTVRTRVQVSSKVLTTVYALSTISVSPSDRTSRFSTLIVIPSGSASIYSYEYH